MLLGLIARINFAKILLISSSLNIVWYVYFFPNFFFIVHGTILCRARFLTQGWVICQADIYHPQNSDICHPQIRTFTTPKNRTFARRTTATPNFFSFFLAHVSWLFRLTAHGGHQGWEGGGAWWGGHGAYQVEGAWRGGHEAHQVGGAWLAGHGAHQVEGGGGKGHLDGSRAS